MAALVLPAPLQRRAEARVGDFLRPAGAPEIDFAQPRGEPALLPPGSVAWKVFKNPIVLFVGGVAAVILELAEPRVRAGVWGHTGFRVDPVGRLQRTGMAAMVTVYAARSVAERLIEGVNRRHARVSGLTEDGRPYAASDPELLAWVQTTALYGFGEAYHRFARPLGPAERDRLWGESAEGASLYGAADAPASHAQWRARLDAMTPSLTASPVVFEFLDLVRGAPLGPAPTRPLQHLLVGAAVSLTPPRVAQVLGLEPGLNPLEAAAVRGLALAADRLVLETAPPAQACRRLGLPADWLYRD